MVVTSAQGVIAADLHSLKQCSQTSAQTVSGVVELGYVASTTTPPNTVLTIFLS